MEQLRARSAALELPMAQVGLAWVLRQPGISATLIGARSPAQVDQAFAADKLAATSNE